MKWHIRKENPEIADFLLRGGFLFYRDMSCCTVRKQENSFLTNYKCVKQDKQKERRYINYCIFNDGTSYFLFFIPFD